MERPIYLDYNATTPVDYQVLETMLPYFTEQFGNASSIQHAYGWETEEAVDLAREQVAQLLNARPQEIIFTSGATEAINLAIQGYFDAHTSKGTHIITCATEHKAVLDVCEYLEKKGARVTYLDVNGNGLVSLDELKKALRDDTILVSLMLANNETGVIQPIDEISQWLHEQDVALFVDATQAVGKIPVDVRKSEVDLMALSGHKMYGPKGVGALFRNKERKMDIVPQLFGGGHERGLRAGTLNIPGIVGLGKACEIAGQEMNEEQARLEALRDYMQKDLEQLGSVSVNGGGASRLPHVLNISFDDIDGHKLMRSLKGVAVAQGSACNASVTKPSHVLLAMNVPESLAYASLRISLGRYTTEEDVRKASKRIRGAVEQLRLQLF